MICSTEEFRLVVKAARRVGTPLVAVRTADPASAIAQVSASVNGKGEVVPVVTENLIRAENPGIAAIGEIIRFSV